MAADDNGNERVTLALVGERLEGIRELTRAGFSDTQRQLDALVKVPEQLVDLRGKHEALARRVTDIEHDEEHSREWKRGPLLLLASGLFIAAINLIPALLK